MCDNIDPSIRSKYTDPLGRAEDLLERIEYAESMIRDIIESDYLRNFKMALKDSKSKVIQIISSYAPRIESRIRRHEPREFWIFNGYDNK